jgi:5-methyltetrahydrofolate--homocysteine methyltransferase
MLGMTAVIEEVERAGLRDSVKVVLGGAPVSRRFAESVGADGYAPDASSAVKMIRDLLGIPVHRN